MRSFAPRAALLLMLGLAVPAAMPSPVAAKQAAANSEAANRALVLSFYERFFVNHEIAAAEDLIAPDYIQHNPHLANGRAGLIAYFKDFFAKNPQAKPKILRVAADGDLVWLHLYAQMTPDDPGQVIVDIFRVKDGKLVEHWDVLQPVPEKSASGNTVY